MSSLVITNQIQNKIVRTKKQNKTPFNWPTTPLHFKRTDLMTRSEESRQNAESSSKNCICNGPSCICCLDFNISFVDLGGPGNKWDYYNTLTFYVVLELLLPIFFDFVSLVSCAMHHRSRLLLWLCRDLLTMWNLKIRLHPFALFIAGWGNRNQCVVWWEPFTQWSC